MAFLEWLQSTWIAGAVVQYGPFYPTLESLHYVGIAFLVGAIMLIDMRLLGLARRLPLNHMITLLPWVWAGFALNALTGGIMFTYGAINFGTNPVFWVKMSLILLAGVNALIFEILARRGRHTWVLAGVAPLPARLVATASLLLWMSVVATGRWMAYI